MGHVQQTVRLTKVPVINAATVARGYNTRQAGTGRRVNKAYKGVTLPLTGLKAGAGCWHRV